MPLVMADEAARIALRAITSLDKQPMMTSDVDRERNKLLTNLDRQLDLRVHLDGTLIAGRGEEQTQWHAAKGTGKKNPGVSARAELVDRSLVWTVKDFRSEFKEHPRAEFGRTFGSETKGRVRASRNWDAPWFLKPRPRMTYAPTERVVPRAEIPMWTLACQAGAVYNVPPPNYRRPQSAPSSPALRPATPKLAPSTSFNSPSSRRPQSAMPRHSAHSPPASTQHACTHASTGSTPAHSRVSPSSAPSRQRGPPPPTRPSSPVRSPQRRVFAGG